MALNAYEAAAICLFKSEVPSQSLPAAEGSNTHYEDWDEDDAYFSEPETPSPDRKRTKPSKTSGRGRSSSALGFRPLSAQSYRSTSSQSNNTRLARHPRSPPGNSMAYKSHPRYSFINSPLSYKNTQRYSALRPSPLRIQKNLPSSPGPSPLTPSPRNPTYAHDQTNLPATPPHSADDPFFPNSVSLQLSASTKSFFDNQTYQLSPMHLSDSHFTDARLTDFVQCLANHTQVVVHLIDEAKRAQMQRSASQRWDRSVGESAEDGKIAERKAYIERRRKEGWKMERFDATRIQRVCERALEEL